MATTSWPSRLSDPSGASCCWSAPRSTTSSSSAANDTSQQVVGMATRSAQQHERPSTSTRSRFGGPFFFPRVQCCTHPNRGTRGQWASGSRSHTPPACAPADDSTGKVRTDPLPGGFVHKRGCFSRADAAHLARDRRGTADGQPVGRIASWRQWVVCRRRHVALQLAAQPPSLQRTGSAIAASLYSPQYPNFVWRRTLDSRWSWNRAGCDGAAMRVRRRAHSWQWWGPT